MRSKTLLRIACSLAVLAAATLAASGSAAQGPTTTKPHADVIASQWRFPGALEAGITSHPTNPILQLEEYAVKQPLGKVWKFYAEKCGFDKEYKEDVVYQTQGKNAEGGLFIVHDRILNGRRWGYFAYNTKQYTVSVFIVPVPDDPKSTSIAVTVGVP